MKAFGYVMLSILIVFFLYFIGLLLGVVTLPLHMVSNVVQTDHDIIDKTINADNAIYNYEWFKQQYEDIKAMENKIRIAHISVETFKLNAPDRDKWTFEDKNEYNRLSAVEQGLKSEIESMTATYNARSKMANRVIFRDGLIPQTLELGKNILINL